MVEPRSVMRMMEAPPAVPTEPIWRLSVDQYHDMIEAGVLTDDDPVELLEGWLITKMPKSPGHRLATQLVREAIEHVLPPGWFVDAQEPMTTADSEPEPDVMVVRGDRRQYRDRHPGAADIALVVEVSDATLHRDRTFKKRLYARAGVAEYWIVNLVEGRIEAYTEPTGPSDTPDYRQRSDFGAGEAVAVIVDGTSMGGVAVDEVLP